MKDELIRILIHVVRYNSTTADFKESGTNAFETVEFSSRGNDATSFLAFLQYDLRLNLSVLLGCNGHVIKWFGVLGVEESRSVSEIWLGASHYLT